MNILRNLQWINRHGTASVLLALLLLLCRAAHFIVIRTIPIFSDMPLESWPPRLLRNVAGIELLQAKWWLTLMYVLIFFSALIYMELRATPRWAVWTSFVFMSLPIFGYLLTCIRVGTGFITVIGYFNLP